MVLPNFFHPAFESKTPGPSYPQPPTPVLPSTVLLVMAVRQAAGKVAQLPLTAVGSTQALGFPLPPVSMNWVPAFMPTGAQGPLNVVAPAEGSSMVYPRPKGSGWVQEQSVGGMAHANSEWKNSRLPAIHRRTAFPHFTRLVVLSSDEKNREAGGFRPPARYGTAFRS